MGSVPSRWKWVVVLGLFVAGCHNGLPVQELKDIKSLQRGWLQILSGHETRLTELAPSAYVAPIKVVLPDSVPVVVVVPDTATPVVKPVNVQANRIQESFSRAVRIHLYNLKEMRIFLQDTESWTIRIEEKALSAEIVRRGWAAKVALFDQLYARMKQSESTLVGLSPAFKQTQKDAGNS